MTFIHRSEVMTNAWIDTTALALDGKEHFRERKQFGNRHAIFDRGSSWGTIHYDEHNAVDFPVGTVNHLAKYANERTGINEGVARAALWIGAAYLGYRALKILSRNL